MYILRTVLSKLGRINPLCESVRVTWSGIWGTMTLIRVLRPIVFLIAFSVTPGAGHIYFEASPLSRSYPHDWLFVTYVGLPIINRLKSIDSPFVSCGALPPVQIFQMATRSCQTVSK